jgi:hypothetical protein
MADIRIKDLATTATTTVSDDYLAIDGATNGTRKMSAYSPVFSGGVADAGGTIAAQRNALAPAQGLYFDGTGSQAVVSKAVPAIFTIAATVNPTTLGSSGRVIAGSGSSFEFGVSAAGLPYIYDGITVRYGTTAIVAGVATHIAYTRTGTTGVFYVNGVTAGTVTDSNTYGSITSLGGANSTSGMLGTISNFLLENRALSAAEVLALYQTRAPAAADYPLTPAGVVVNTSNCTTDGSYTTFTGASATGFHAAVASGSGFASVAPAISIKAGTSFRVTGNIAFIGGKTVIPVVYADDGTGQLPLVGSAVDANFSVVITSVMGGTAIKFSTIGDASYTISNLVVMPLGLLLAPEPQALGSGLVWRDISGNAANITLPASGVSWALPWSGTLGFASGTNAAPTVTFGANTNTGLYLDATNVLGVATNGNGTVLFSSSAGVGKIKAHGTRVLALEAGTGNTNITLTPSGTGIVSVTGALTASTTVSDAGGTIAAQRNGLAPAQALSFDGTASCSQAVSADGTSDFSKFVLLYLTAQPSGDLSLTSTAVNASTFMVKNGTRRLSMGKYAVGYVASTSSTDIPLNVWCSVGVVRTGGVLTYYLNSVADGTSVDVYDYSAAATSILGSGMPSGSALRPVSSLNRALSAAEVLALYQSGAVAAGDINSASNTNILSSADSTFSSDTGNWVLQPGSTISGGKLNIADTKFVYYYPKIYSAGQHVRIKGTLDSITGGALRYFNGSAYVTLLSAPGSFDVEYVQAVAGQVFINSVGGNSVLDNFYIYSLGALIAPEANAPGAGLEWLDVSGNRAHIVLPTSGVSWALPSSQQIVIEATTNTATNQQLGAASLIDTNKQWRIQSWTVNCSTGTPTISLGNASAGAQYVSALVLAAGNNDITLLTRFPTTANLWCNSSTTATLIHRIVLVPAN